MTQPKESTGRLLAGRYRLDEVLGRGGMGTVWRAEDEMLGRIVAVKELRMTGAVDEEEKHRLVVRTLREAKATARIRHTAAVTVFDVVEEDERPWIVMELVESRSLAEVIKDDGTLTPVRAAEIALDLLGVLGAAHSHGILHRDVKPSNVLIGEDGRVVLTDFGIASVEGDTSITSTGMLVGAPSYISPERARGQKPGPPADLWSLGGTLYAMVEGRPPYDRGSALATLTAVMTEDLVVPDKAGPLRPVIEGLLIKDPAERLDAAGARAMLKRIVADGSARAEATTQQAVPVAGATPKGGDATSGGPAGSAAEAGGRNSGAKGGGAKGGGGRTGGAEAPAAAGDRKASAKPVGTATPAAEAGAVADTGSADGRTGGRKSLWGGGAPAGDKPASPLRGAVGTVRVGSRSAAPAMPPAAPVEPPAGGPVTAPIPAVEDGSKRRLRLAVAGLVALVLGVVLLAALLPSGDKKDKDGTGGTAAGTAVSQTAGAASPAAVPPAASGAPSATATQGAGQSAGQTAAPGTTAGGTTTGTTGGQATAANPAVPPAGGTGLPAGYSVYRDSQGFSIAVPSWLSKQPGGDIRRTFTGNGYKLVVEWTDQPGPSALAVWQASDRSANFPNYQRIGVAAAPFREWTNSADWEWTYSGNGTTLHALDRGFVTTDKKYGYAIYWTIPDADWSSPAAVEARKVSYDTFQPAP